MFAGHPWFEDYHDAEVIKKQIEDYFDRPNVTMCLAESEGKIKGFAWGFLRETPELISTKFSGEESMPIAAAIREAIPQERMFYTNEVGVDKDLRGRGLGKLLMDNLLAVAGQLNVPAALTTRIDTVLTPICLKTGFRQVFGQEVVIDQNKKVVVTGKTLIALRDEPERTFFVRSNL